MKIVTTSVLVDHREKGLDCYTNSYKYVLGFVRKTEIPMRPDRGLTAMSPQDPDRTERLLQPDAHPAARPFKQALMEERIPFTSFGVFALPLILAVWFASAAAAPPAAAADADRQHLVRFQRGDEILHGVLEGNHVIALAGDFFGQRQRTDRSYSLDSVKLLAPVEPTKVLAAALNYKSHLEDREAPQKPEFFFKPPSCVIATGEPIVLPSGSNDVHYEAELVIVIGRQAKDAPIEQALDYVLGITCGNDVSARDWQEGDIQWWRAKGADTFGPVGPVIATGVDYGNLALEGRLNGEVKQKANSNDLLFGVAEMVSFASRHVTLEPGDLIFTGAPGVTSPLSAGDVFEVEIEGVGVLSNPVQAQGAATTANPRE